MCEREKNTENFYKKEKINVEYIVIKSVYEDVIILEFDQKVIYIFFIRKNVQTCLAICYPLYNSVYVIFEFYIFVRDGKESR